MQIEGTLRTPLAGSFCHAGPGRSLRAGSHPAPAHGLHFAGRVAFEPVSIQAPEAALAGQMGDRRPRSSGACPKGIMYCSCTLGVLLWSAAIVVVIGTRLALNSPGGLLPLFTYHPEHSWQYWEVCGRSQCPQLLRYSDGADPPADQEKFLLLETRGCGFNNERDSFEQAFALAYMWRRTLVLPPFMGTAIYPEQLFDPGEAYDLVALNQSIKVITAGDFVMRAKAKPEHFGGEAAVAQLGINPKEFGKAFSWDSFPGWFAGTEGVARDVFAEMNASGRIGLVGTAESASSQEYQTFATTMRPGPPIVLSSEDWKAPVLRLVPRVMIGNYYSRLFIPGAGRRAEVRHAIRQTMRLRREYFEAAAAAMAAAGLAPGDYGALHNRQGDWQIAPWAMYLDPARPGLFTNQTRNQQFLQAHSTIYIATNPDSAQAALMDKHWYPAIKSFMPAPRRVVTLSDPAVYQAAAAHAGQFKDWQGMVDMIICSRAREFLGTWGSTFSGYIQRLRGYMPDVPNKRIQFYERSRERPFTGRFPSWSTAAAAAEIELVEWNEGFSDLEGIGFA